MPTPPPPKPQRNTAPRNTKRPRSSPGDDVIDSARPARRRFFIVAGVFLFFTAVPYLHGTMADYRYLDQIDARPLWRAVTFGPVGNPTAAASITAGSPTAGLPEAGIEEGLTADPALKEAAAPPNKVVAAAKKPKKGTPAAKPAKPDVKLVGAAPEEPPAAPARAGPLPQALRITDGSIGKHKVFIEDPERAMDGFYEALTALGWGERAKVRVRHYGDSHIANDGTTHALRVLLQRRFGEGGHGFVLAKSRTRWYKHKGIKHISSKNYTVRNFLGGGLRDGAYGYGGVAASGGSGQSFRVDTAPKGVGKTATTFEFFYRSIGPATVAVTADGKRLANLITRPGTGDGYRMVRLPDGPHRVRVAVRRGKVRMFGMAVERDSGLVYDSLGVVGARASRWLNVRAPHLHGQLKHRKTDLLVLNYGGNSRNDKTSKARYKKRFGMVIKRLRPNKDEACLIIGPSDHGKRKGGKIISDPATKRLIGWQREIALSNDCAFLDARKVMGGEGAMGRWARRGLGWHDYAHFTPKGMRTMGTAIYAAYLHGLRGYLGRTRDAAAP